jgi:hypothetical protein
MAINVKLLKKVRKVIAEEPRRLLMRTWGRHVDKRLKDSPPCGTVACLAGWTVLAAHPRLKFRGSLHSAIESKKQTPIIEYAANLLGIDEDNCPFLEMSWEAPRVLAWIDAQIAKAK